MSGEHQRRLAVEPELVKQLVGAGGHVDVAELRLRFDVIPDMVDVGELGRTAAEIFPDPAQDRFDLFGRLLGECGGQIGAADFVLTQQWADGAGGAREKIRRLLVIEIARGAQHADGQRADCGPSERLGGVANALLDRHLAGQAGSRVRISEAFWPPKPNEFDITAVTLASRALLPTTSNWIVGSGIS